MNEMTLGLIKNSPLHEALIELMWKASEVIYELYHSDNIEVRTKDNHSPVTEADLAAHQVLVQGLSLLTPEIPVVSEEDSDSLMTRKTHARYWLIDPLDGTREFMQRNDQFTCNLALIDHSRTRYGFVSVPAYRQLYHGGQDFGAQRVNRDGTKTSIECRKQMQPIRVVASKSHLNDETKEFIEAIGAPVELIRAGSSLKFLRIAEGAADLYPRLGDTCEWDTAAAQAILEGAGGAVLDLKNSPLAYSKDDVINPYFVAYSQTSSFA